MSTQPFNESTDANDSHSQSGGSILTPLAKASQILRKEGDDLLSCASESIRKNPVSSVLGAFAIGLVIGGLIVVGKHAATTEETFIDDSTDLVDHISETVRSGLARLGSNLKFW